MDLRDSVALSRISLSVRRRAQEALRCAAEATGERLELTLERCLDAIDRRPLADSLRMHADADLARAAQSGLLPYCRDDPRYPHRLAMIFDPPPVIWVSGQVAALSEPAVAIVGSRAGSPYALEVAERLGADLASRGVSIVSGLARGVDSAAHRGALDGGGRTVAVLGSGADVVYPSEHQALAKEIAHRGAVTSELPPGTPPRAGQFPMRNRIISGLSQAVVVVEANEKSGSLITANCALEQGRDVMVVPGNVLTGRNRGSHSLLRDGAKIVESADDILEELGLSVAPHHPAEGAAATERDVVLGAMGEGESWDLDALAVRVGLPAPALLGHLLTLELGGRIRRLEGGQFARCRLKW